MIAGSVSYKCVPAARQEKPPFNLRRIAEPSRMQSQTLNMNLQGETINVLKKTTVNR